MSLSTSATFNPVLSDALNKIGENKFVGLEVLPVREVATKNGQYPVFDTDQFDINDSETRAPGSNFARRDFQYSQASYTALQYALEGVLPDEDESQAKDDGISDAAGAIAQKLQRDLMVGHEKRVADLLANTDYNAIDFTGSKYGGGAMSVSANAKPILAVQDAVETLNGNGFFDNLSLIIESSLFNEMINTTNVREIFNGNSQYTDRQVILDALGVNKIIICPTRRLTSAKGQTGTRGKIWSTTKMWVGQTVGGDFANGGFGRTLSYAPDGGVFTAETYRDEPIKSDVLRVYNSVDEVVNNTNAIVSITGV